MRIHLSKAILFFLCCPLFVPTLTVAAPDDGYELWLKYRRIDDEQVLAQYLQAIQSVALSGESPTVDIIREELTVALREMLSAIVPFRREGGGFNSLIIGTPKSSDVVGQPKYEADLRKVGREGYLIKSVPLGAGRAVIIAANNEIALLRAVFHFLRLMQTQQPLADLNIISKPKIQYRLLNHWDNLTGSIERGYAGNSLWKWGELPDVIDERYHDYARANASIGINGVVVNNVNANPQILKLEYLKKVTALANIFRPYGIRVFLSANFSSPISAQFEIEGNRRAGIGTLPNSDPLNPEVRLWWREKVKEIYALIPDFGGFLVKANSEGMPGPLDYGRTHAEGANMLAEALEPFGGIVMWRAFVYNADVDADRVKRAYMEFVPLDGKFHKNVFIQPKNGPLDFQPREPIQPLFGAMPKTPLMLELQITQEYLGHSKHLVYLAPMWKEYLDFDTYAKGSGSTLASIIDGSLHGYSMTGIAGVANTGNERNWTGHLFAQANWYAYGRLAWDHSLSAEQIADEWVKMSLGNVPDVVKTVKSMMMGSWEACINYMTPLGLHHIMEVDVHYGPGPDVAGAAREDWNSVYYHRADSVGLGFNRNSTGSNAVNQYYEPWKSLFDNIETCPEEYLLWFHHVPWDYKLKSGKTLWQELCARYYAGTRYVQIMIDQWETLKSTMDPEIFSHVKAKLERQQVDAGIWRDTCLKYFQQFSKMPIVIPE